MRFNVFTSRSKQVTNHEGAIAHKVSPALELYSAVVTASLSDKFYETAGTRLDRIRTLIAQNDPIFVAKLAVYAREKMHLRSVPLVLAVELAKVHKGNNLVSRLVARVVQRADEITELLAFYTIANERTGTKQLNRLSKQIQKGLADAFNQFDEYQLAKYNRDASIKLRDALFLVHPKAKDEAQQALFDKLASNTLATPYTWETQLSATGQKTFTSTHEKQLAVSATWEGLILSHKLGYMALLRNLRNILEADVSPSVLQKVVEHLSDPKAVAKSKQLPFRFLAAWREVKQVQAFGTPQVLAALESAALAASANLIGFDWQTKVVIACDVSGSMQTAISPKSKIMHYDIGLMLAMMLQTTCKQVTTGMFGNTWKRIPVPKNAILTNVEAFHRREGEVGYATNGHLVIQDLINQNKVVDKILIFTDCQLWDTRGGVQTMQNVWNTYRKIAPNAKLYLFDLAGYGQAPLNLAAPNVYLVAGWSDKIFDVLNNLENGLNTLHEVEKIEV